MWGVGAELWPTVQGLAKSKLGGGRVGTVRVFLSGRLSSWLLHWSVVEHRLHAPLVEGPGNPGTQPE